MSLIPVMADGVESIEEIGNRIRTLRLAMGYENATAFAKYIGWSPQQLSNYETGTKRPEITMANKLCRKTGVTLDYIYRDEYAGLPLHVANMIRDYLDRQASISAQA